MNTMQPYSEETGVKMYSIQNLTKAKMDALLKCLQGMPLDSVEKTEIDRIKYAIENPTSLNTKKK